MISYDTNILIYALESTSDHAIAARKVVTKGEAEGAVLSVLLKQEILTGRVLMGAGTDFAKEALDSLMGARWVEVNDTIIFQAVELTRKYGNKIKGYDAVILATAIVGGVSKFYTNDKSLDKLGVTEIDVLPPFMDS